MFPTAALLALCLSAASAAAAPSLSLAVTGPSDAAGIESLKVVATVTNTGDEEVKLLNDPRGALSQAPTNTFAIKAESGSAPAFRGMRVKYEPETVIGLDSAAAFTVLAPGQSVDVEHDIASAYNFTLTGEGTYSIEASNLFFYVDPATQRAVEIRADTAEATHAASLSGKLASSGRAAGLAKRIEHQSCSSSEQSTLVEAAAAAQTYAEESQSYLSDTSSGTDRYTEWFGTYSSSRHSTVLEHFSNMLDHPYDDYTYDCSCDEEGVYAYVYPDDFGTIYLCPVFWQTTTTGTDSRAGTLIHESSHFAIIGGTDDYVYGQPGARDLADSNPNEAVENADSHEYFAENNPQLD